MELQELSNERAAYEDLKRKLTQQGLLLKGRQRLGTPTFGGDHDRWMEAIRIEHYEFVQVLKILRKGCDPGCF